MSLVHGPNLATREILGTGRACERNRLSLHRALFDPAQVVDETVEFLVPGSAEGRLVGGCLSLVASMLGTRFALSTEDAILFLEDVGEAPYRIDRMLTQLRIADVFAGVQGVVFGTMRNCKDAYNDVRDVIRDVLGGYKFPIAFGLESGHSETNLSLRLGALAQLDGTRGQFYSSYRQHPALVTGRSTVRPPERYVAPDPTRTFTG